MRYLIITFMLFPLSLWADTTGNLLNQNFTTWSGTNQSSRHDASTIAGVDGKFVESTISLSDTLTESQINNGWTSTLGADIWHWNNYTSTTTMKQTITNSDGTVTTQIREVANTGCGYINCGDWATYTDSYTQGINQQSDYDIAVRFTFDESHNSSSHYATDLKNPTLTIIHSLITTEQAETLSEISETVNEIIETEVETIEFEPLEEYTFEVFAEPEVVFEMLEEIYFVPLATEEINTGIIDIFFELIEPEEFTELIELPMEVTYEEPQEAFSTEVESFEETIETTETIEPTIEVTGGSSEQDKPIETNTNIEEEETLVATAETEEQGGAESIPERESGGNGTGQSANEDEASSESGETSRETDTSSNTDIESGDDSTGEVSSVDEEPIQVDIEDITREVERTITNVDEQLVATQILIAKVMSNNDILKGYGSVNQAIFDNQIEIYGGNLDEYIRRNYVDNRDIYSQIKIKNNLSLFHYQEQVQKAVDERIRAEEHLRSVRGY